MMASLPLWERDSIHRRFLLILKPSLGRESMRNSISLLIISEKEIQGSFRRDTRIILLMQRAIYMCWSPMRTRES